MSKKILITGSTDGIGKLAAIRLALEGHVVILHGRNREKLDACMQEVKEQTGSDTISGYLADFSDLEAVRSMADQVKSDHSELDVLINNAGIYNSPTTVNKDGLDIRFVVNYLAPVVLTRELFSLLARAQDPRIINLGSAAQAPVNLSSLQNGGSLSDQSAYAQSNLALTMWSFFQAKVLNGVSTIVVNPGSLLDTKMVKEAFGQVWASADKGAEILKDLALSDEYRGITGRYYDNDRGGFGQAHPDANDTAKLEELINVTESLLYAQS